MTDVPTTSGTARTLRPGDRFPDLVLSDHDGPLAVADRARRRRPAAAAHDPAVIAARRLSSLPGGVHADRRRHPLRRLPVGGRRPGSTRRRPVPRPRPDAAVDRRSRCARPVTPARRAGPGALRRRALAGGILRRARPHPPPLTWTSAERRQEPVTCGWAAHLAVGSYRDELVAAPEAVPGGGLELHTTGSGSTGHRPGARSALTARAPTGKTVPVLDAHLMTRSGASRPTKSTEPAEEGRSR